jgi:amino acid adenylation domain-containing protein/thioester reductase-like protein
MNYFTKSETASTHIAYWKQQLAEIPVLQLPITISRKEVEIFARDTQSFCLSTSLSLSLKELSSKEGTTLFMTLMAAFKTLLHRYTGQDDLLVGTFISTNKGINGSFVNTLALRTDLSGNLTFRELLLRVREVVLAAEAHSDIAFEDFLEELQLELDVSDRTLFPVMFTLASEQSENPNISNFNLSNWQQESQIGKYDFNLFIEDTESGLKGAIQYNSNRFDPVTISHAIAHLQTLLKAIVANPEQQISQLPLLTTKEQQTLLMEWNRTQLDYPQNYCIHQLFEAQVEQTPDAVAVVFDDKQLTYRELNNRANQLAHHLKNLGVKPEVFVGICIERSLEMVVGLLGILKAGGAYIPLDPAYPQERLAFIIDDSQMSILLTKSQLIESLPQHKARIVYLDRDWENLIAKQSRENFDSTANSHNLAYTIYTSGSTGKPKGVLIEHNSAIALLQWAKQVFTSEELAGVLASTSICFDLSVFELFVPLSWGGKVILIENILHLPNLRAAEQVTLINTVPSAIAELLRINGIPTSVITVNLAGEPLPNPLAQKIYQQSTIQKVFNLYGPSEDTTYSTFALVEKDGDRVTIGHPIANTQVYLLDNQLQPVPVGVVGEVYIGGAGLARGYLNRPDLTAQRFILNPFIEVETANSLHPSLRLYKTGDLARYLPDGNIDYIGRIDHQVKIRGFRIELGEIESLLLLHPTVRDAVAIAREDFPGDRRLVAYIVSHLTPDRVPYHSPASAELDSKCALDLTTVDLSRNGVCLTGTPASWTPGKNVCVRLLLPTETQTQWWEGKVAWCQGRRAGIQFTLTSTEQMLFDRNVQFLLEQQGFLKMLQRTLVGNLRDFLQEKLPEYMIPSKFVFLNALPLTPNGKVDRKALPIPDRIRTELEENFIAPRTPKEEKLAEIWAEIIGVEQVGIYDNFLSLGGHSLLATRIISRLREIYQVELPIHHIFEQPTVAAQAELIETILQEGVKVTSIQEIDRTGNLPLSFAQERLWFLDQLIPENPFYNMTEAVYLKGAIDLPILEKSFNEIIQRHESLRTIFVTVDGKPVQIIQEVSHFKISVVNLTEIPATEREAKAIELATQEARQLFNLSQDLLIKVTLIQLDEQKFILLLKLHHILADDWSLGVLFRELTAIYQAFFVGNPSPLPKLPIQYADFALWQRQWLEGKVQQEQLLYWEKQLANLPILQLPTDRPRPAVPSYRGALHSLTLSKTLTAALKALSQKEGVTLFMTLLAAFQTLLLRYTGAEDIPVGSAIANRHQLHVDKLIGFFANTIVLRTDVSGSPTFKELLVRVREVALTAYAHQDLPFEKLVAKFQPERDLSRQALFQVVFALQNELPSQDLQLPNIQTTSLTIDNKTAKFDLFLQLSDKADGLTGWIEYNSDLFDSATISRLIGHFQTLLKAIVANPEKRISELPLLTQIEKHQLLVDRNNTQADYRQDVCIHQLFEQRVQETPDAIAVVFQDQQLTYQELNYRANQLAHQLQTLGIKPEVLVGICVESSIEMIVGILAILKAGGAYLPLDPAYPLERLTFMLEDANISILLTKSQYLESFKTCKSKVICLDTAEEILTQESQNNPHSNVTIKNLAYVIYTSGSTGQPKGVEIEHGGLLNLVFWHQNTFTVSHLDRATQIAGVAFDACVWEIWPYLAAGASIYIPDDETRRSPEHLRDWLVSKAITISFLPTPLAELLLLLNWPENTALRILLTGGDRLTQYPLASHPFRLVNNYGPTENTVVTTSGEVPVRNQANVAPAIGRPIANTQVYILDKNLQPVPIGVPGELYIGGASLARGYLNRSDLSTQRFIANPFFKDSSRLYKTGDLVRYRPDGNIEFLGRIDRQVKIRGFRIELGEIQAILSQHPAVQAVAVIDMPTARWREGEDVPNQKRLVAYVVPNRQYQKESDDLADLDTEYISQWQTLYEGTYSQTPAHQDATFNIIGWNSSYTGLPIPEVEMSEWVNQTVERILSLQPNRVLEIGCGTGLLLSRIAPHSTKYWGMDFSQEAIQYLEQLKLAKPELQSVTLLHRTADNFQGIAPDSFDIAILNSIVQYFPSIDYLLSVLESAAIAVRNGGCIFVGDVRSLPLLEAYHASIELHQASDSLTRSQFLSSVGQRIAQEEELAIDPAFFIELKQHLPQISHVQIQLKRGVHHNELTRFRYDVILHLGNEAVSTVDIPWLNWQQQNLTLSAIRHLLEETQPEILGLRNVPNARIFAEVKTLEWFGSSEPPETLGQLRLEKLSHIEQLAVDPESFWNLSEELPYAIAIGGSQWGADGCYDVVLRHRNATKAIASSWEESNLRLKPWHLYANNPLKGKVARHIIPQLRHFLQNNLPDYMVPSAFVLLDALPVTPNGKLDRRALPSPEISRNKLQENLAESQNPVEKQVISLWTKILGIENIGIDENFFELGGNSLLAAQLISYIKETFRIELPVRCLFENPTGQKLAQTIQTIHQKGISSLNFTAIDFAAEAVLAPEIVPQGKLDDISNPQHIFLTGSTGFVGAFLLHELLEQTSAKIYCLVRASNEKEGFQRLQETLEKYQIWNSSHSSRIIPVCGDLDRPLLGIPPEQFAHLAIQIDKIYHNGAQVNFAKPYSAMKAANVQGTEEVLRLACQGKLKPVHYISTCGVYGPIGYLTGIQLIKEDDDIDIAKDYLYPDIGYVQSKWVAEKIVHIAKSREIPISIYRLGAVMGHTKTGVANTSDYVCRTLKGCIEIGCYPNLVNQKMEFVSVDYVSKALVHLSRRKESLGKAFHITPPPSHNVNLVEFFDLVNSFGYSLKKLPYPEWKEKLIQQTKHSQTNPLFPLLPMFTEKVYRDSFTIQELYQHTPDFDCQNTFAGLAGTDIIFTPMSKQLLKTYLSYLISIGFVNYPN